MSTYDTEEPTVVLATTDEAFERKVREACEGLLPGGLRRWAPFDTETHPARIVDALVGPVGTVEVVALGPGVPLGTALDLATFMDRERPEISVVLVTDPTAEVWERALRAGVRDLAAPDAAASELRDVFERAIKTASRRRSNLVGQADAAPRGRIITVLSPKGGAGKTTVSTNLAVGLAAANPNEVVIVDLDLQFGDVATALQLVPEATMVDASRTPDLLDPMALKVYLTPHPAGLYALCGPDSPADGEVVKPEHVTQVLNLLTMEFPYVVVDTSAGLNEHALAALELSTDAVFVCSMDVPSVRSLGKELRALDQLDLTSQRRHFVLNRADTRVGLDAGDVEATVGMTVDVALSSSRSVPLSMNQGTPVLLTEPRSPVGREFSELVARFVDQPVRAGGGLFRRKKVTR